MNDYVHVKVSIGANQLQSYSFDRMPINIGRVSDCQIVLDNAGVSRLHACIEREDDNLRIVDLGSGNGTFVNGKPIEKAWVTSSDTIRIGKFTLTVRFSALAETTQSQRVSSSSTGREELHSQTIELSADDRKKVLVQAKALKERDAAQKRNKPKVSYLPKFLLFVVGAGFGLLLSWFFK